jgi:hypothetical protein
MLLSILLTFGLIGTFVNTVLGLYYIGERIKPTNLKNVAILIGLVLGQLLLSTVLYALIGFGFICLF